MRQVSDDKYKGYHYQPTHTYHFHPAILRCNRQINEEATAVFHNTNLFISISHNYSHMSPESPGRKSSLLEHYYQQEGLPILASLQSRRIFKYFAMEIYFGKTQVTDSPGLWWNSPKSQEWNARPRFMIACDDLLEFCKVFMFATRQQACIGKGFDTMTHLETAMLLVDVLHTTNLRNGANECLLPAAQRLLEPLCYLHNIGLVIIEGSAPKSYTEMITQTIQRQAPSAQDVILSTSALKEQGDAEFLKGEFHSAALKYKTAIDQLYPGSGGSIRHELMTTGRYTGMPIGLVKNLLVHRLHLGLAKANFQLQKYEMAHHWTTIVIDRPIDTKAQRSQMWYYRGLASRELGEAYRAYREMRRAHQIRPSDPEILSEMAIMSRVLKMKE